MSFYRFLPLNDILPEHCGWWYKIWQHLALRYIRFQRQKALHHLAVPNLDHLDSDRNSPLIELVSWMEWYLHRLHFPNGGYGDDDARCFDYWCQSWLPFEGLGSILRLNCLLMELKERLFGKFWFLYESYMWKRSVITLYLKVPDILIRKPKCT